MRSDAGLVEQLRCELARDRFDLAGELALFSGQLQDASCERAQREHVAAHLDVVTTVRSCRCEALQQPRPCQRPQLAEPGASGVDRAFPCGYQRLQRLPFTTGTRCCRPLLSENTAGRTDSVERVGLAPRAALPPQPADLEHLLAATSQEARKTGTERTGALDRERTPTWCVLVDELQHLRIAVAVCDHRRLKHDSATDDVHNSERMRIAMRVDTNDVVQL